MNPELFQQGQGSVASQMLEDSSLAERSKLNKVVSLVGASFRKAVVPVAAALVVTLGGGGVASQAHAQSFDWNTWNSNAATAPVVDQAQAQAQQRMMERQRQQAEAEARAQAQRAENEANMARQQKQRDDQATARILGDVVANVGGQAVYANGGNYNQANSIRDLGKVAVNTAMGQDGNTTGQRVGIGALAGSALAGLLSKDQKSAGANTAVGALLGTAVGYGWDTIAQKQKAAEDAARAQAQAQARAAQAQAQAEAQASMRYAQGQPQPTSYNAVGQQQRQLIVYDPASLGLPQVMVDLARAKGGIVAPGSRPFPTNAEAIRGEPLLDNAMTSLAVMSHTLAERATLIDRMDQLRASGANQIQIGSAARDIAKADAEARQTISTSIDLINVAAARGGYDTRMMLSMAGNVVAKGYVQDSTVGFKANTRYGIQQP